RLGPRRRPAAGRGSVSAVQLLARRRARPDRPDRRRAGAVRAAAVAAQRRRAPRRGGRPAGATDGRQLSAGVHAPLAGEDGAPSPRAGRAGATPRRQLTTAVPVRREAENPDSRDFPAARFPPSRCPWLSIRYVAACWNAVARCSIASATWRTTC